MKRERATKGGNRFEKFAKELSRRIAKAQMTRIQVGLMLGMRPSTVQSYCGAHARPSRRNLQKLMQMFGEDLAGFIDDEATLVGPTTPPLQIMPIGTDFSRCIVRVEAVVSFEVAQGLRRLLVEAGVIKPGE